jgi:hypothetical protein
MSERLTQSDLERLRVRGLTDETIERAGLYSVDAREGAELVGRPLTALRDLSGIALPNYRPGSEAPRQIRLRLTNPDVEESLNGARKEKNKYLTAAGTPNRFYIPPQTPGSYLQDTSIPIVFVEGEFKALAVDQAYRDAGRPVLVIAVLGVWGFRATRGKEAAANGGTRTISGPCSDFDNILWLRRTVTVCYDADCSSNRRIKQARDGLVDTLTELGANVLVADVPKEDKAIDDLMNEHGQDAGLALLDSARPVGSRFRLIHASELDDLPRSKFIPGTKIVGRGYNLAYGLSGCGKSIYFMGAGYHVAQSGSVVYVAAEGAGGLAARRDAWLQHFGLSLGNIWFIDQPVNLLDLGEVWDFIDAIKAKCSAAELVIFDTKARCMAGADENSAKDDGLQVANCNLIQRSLDCAVAVIHHSGASDLRERGSTVSRNAADSVIAFQRSDDLITVSCSKLKDGEPWPDESYSFVSVADSVVLLPSGRVATEFGKLTAQQIKTLQALALDVFDPHGAKLGQLIELTKLPESSLFRVLSTLKRLGLISQGAKGDPYAINEAGRLRLSDSQSTLSQLSESVTPTTTNSHSLTSERVESRVESRASEERLW